MFQIRYFLALSEELNFTRAAKQCGVSQPSLTNGIIELERHFGGALFRRKPGVALPRLAAQFGLKRLELQAHSRFGIRGGCGLPVATGAEP